MTRRSNCEPSPLRCQPSSTSTAISIAEPDSSSHGAAVAIPTTASSTAATIETPPAGAERCRAVRAVSLGIGTWYRRVRLSYEHLSCMATTEPAVLDCGLAQHRYCAAGARSILYYVQTALGQSARDLHEYVGPGPLGRGVLVEALQVLELLVHGDRVVDQAEYGAEVAGGGVTQYVGLAGADRSTGAAGLGHQRSEVLSGPAGSGGHHQFVDSAGLGGEDL